MAVKPTHYNVYFDTNKVQGGGLLAPDFKELLETKEKSKIITVSYMLPELVQDEWVQHHFERMALQFEKVANADSTFSEFGVSGHLLTLPRIEDVPQMARSLLANMGVKIVATPYNEIDMADLLGRAVKHLPPFEAGEGDKGIKDAIIAQTIKNEFDNPDNAKKNIALVTKDGRMTDYIKELIGESPRFHIFSTIGELQSHIQLRIDDLSEQLATDAAKLFHTANDTRSLYYKYALGRKMAEYYAEHIPDAKYGANYVDSLPSSHSPHILAGYGRLLLGGSGESEVSFGEQTYAIGETTFRGRTGQLLDWSTILVIRQRYVAISNYDNGGIQLIPQKSSGTHTVKFEVNWRTKLSSRLKLMNPAILTIKPYDEMKTIDSPLAASLEGTATAPGEIGNRIIPGGAFSELSSAFHQINEQVNASISPIRSIGPNMLKTLMPNDILAQLAGLPRKHFWEDDPAGIRLDAPDKDHDKS